MRQRCNLCGWDLARGFRTCIHCEGLVTLQGVEAENARLGESREDVDRAHRFVRRIILACCGLAVVMFGGILGLFGALAMIVAVEMFLVHGAIRYACSACGREADPGLLALDERGLLECSRAAAWRRFQWAAGVFAGLGLITLLIVLLR